MKKKLLCQHAVLLFFFLLSFSASSQITVTRTDFAVIGDMVISAHDTTPVVLPGNAGAAQSWDLTGIVNHFSDTIDFVNPTGTPYASNFPTANLAGHNLTDQSYYYADANISNINIIGYVTPNPFTGNPLALPFSPPQAQVTFPSTYLTAFNNNSTAASGSFYMHLVLDSSTNTTADSFRITRSTIRNSVVDGWGSVGTPAGTFNALRQQVIDSTNTLIEAFVYVSGFPFGWQTLPVGGNTVAISYNYLANGQRWSVAQVTTDDAGAITGAQYMLNVVIGIEEYPASGNNDVIFYPNPSAGEMNISVLNSKAALLDVYDMFGRKTESILLRHNSGEHSFSSYANGLYTFRVSNKSGEHISSGKFVIAK